MVIGLLGCEINNNNMGCVALSYSLILLLEKISMENGFSNVYYVFEVNPSNDKIEKLCKQLDVETWKIKSVPVGRFGSITSIVGHLFQNIKTIKTIRKCDLVIDLTQGDSFTDIYGEWIFYSYTILKRLVEVQGVPLVLGPQTYGPFINEKHKKFAVQTIKKANSVITRDILSEQYLIDNGIEKVHVTTDIAFFLPFDQTEFKKEVTKIGINISGLLVKDKVENTETDFSVKTDYDKFITNIVEWLSDQKGYEVFIIPHVREDYEAGVRLLGDDKNRVTFVEPFDSPIDAKSFISDMDVFIGARMHATIASFSSGIATIPVGYSRKFRGLFDTLGYKNLIDLQTEDTFTSIEKAKKMICNWKNVRDDVSACSTRMNFLMQETYKTICQILLSIKEETE